MTALLENGADPNLQCIDKRTALHHAARSNNPSVTKILLNHGADPNLKDDHRKTPLELAAFLHHSSVIEVFLYHKDVDEKTALHHATIQNDRVAIDFLLNLGAKIDATDNQPQTPLIDATDNRASSSTEEAQAIDTLARMTKDKKTLKRNFPSTNSIIFDYFLNFIWIAKLMKLIAFELKQLLNFILMALQLKPLLRFVNFILIASHLKLPDQPANHRANIQDINGRTALHYAAFHNHSFAMGILLKYGAAVDKIDNQLQSILLIATQRNNCHCVKRLYQIANPNLKDDQGKTALEYARENSCKMCIAYLEFAEQCAWFREKLWKLFCYVAVIDIIALGYYVYSEFAVQEGNNFRGEQEQLFLPPAN